jgi:hypothetical protein
VLPDYEPHAALEEDVTSYMKSIGFLVDSAPYHDKMNSEIVQALQYIYAPTALYLRGRADRIAVHRNPPLVFQWEAKTHISQRWHDCCLEALPFCHHISSARLDVECLYVYRDPFKNRDVGFWVSSYPDIREIKIPTSRWSDEQLHYFEFQFRQFLPGTRINRLRRTKGSDDPFLIIDEKVIASLPHWKTVIDDKLDATAEIYRRLR